MGLRSTFQTIGVDSFFNSLIDKEAQQGTTRIPFILTSTLWEQDNVPPIQMSINPQVVSFRQSKRTTSRDTIGGKTFFHWADANGRNLDLLQLTLSGVTGVIAGIGDVTHRGNNKYNNDEKAIQNGRNFMRFYNLTTQPQLLDNFSTNIFKISMSTVAIPVTIEFRGFYSNVLEFSEDANNPFSKSWSVGFTVTATKPAITELSSFGIQIDAQDLVDFVETEGTGSGSGSIV